MSTATTPRPAAMPLNPAGLPDDPIMRERRFVVWGWTWNPEKGKWDKPPFRPLDGHNAAVDNPRDHATLREAVAAVARLKLDGIGLVLTAGCGVVGIDLDKCRNAATGEIADWAQAIIDRFASYWEPSASGTGIRIFVRGQLPPGRRRTGQIEVYDAGRYLTLNGNAGPGASRQFEERTPELAAWHAETFPAPAPPAPPVHRGHPPATVDEARVLDKARAAKDGPKFSALYDRGDWQGQGYDSHSEARQGLCSLLSFWCQDDPDRCERLFMRSALYREDKWPREREKVLGIAYKRSEFYDWAREAAGGATLTLSTLDTPPAPDTADDDLLALPHDELARVAAHWRGVAEGHARRLEAIDQLMTAEGMEPIDRVIAYGVAVAGASAQERKEAADETRDLVVNQKAIACRIHVSRQVVGARVKRWDEQGYLRKDTRGTGVFTKKGLELKETLIQLPASTLTDNLMLAADWKRPEDMPHVGGNGTRCPKCHKDGLRATVEEARVKITTVECLSCGHREETIGKPQGRKVISRNYADETQDIPTAMDPTILARLGRRRATGGATLTLSTLDTPPCPAVDTSTAVVDVYTPGHPPPLLVYHPDSIVAKAERAQLALLAGDD